MVQTAIWLNPRKQDESATALYNGSSAPEIVDNFIVIRDCRPTIFENSLVRDVWFNKNDVYHMVVYHNV